MKIIKISTELEMTIHDFPEGTMREQNKVLCELIGNGCDIVEHVMPKRLYTMLKMSPTPTRTPAQTVQVDAETVAFRHAQMIAQADARAVAIRHAQRIA